MNTTATTKYTKNTKITEGFRVGLLLAVILALCALTAATAFASGSGSAVDWWVFGGGGGSAGGGNVTLDGTLGQPIAGESSGSSLVLQAGYWNSVPVTPEYSLYLPMLRR